MEIYADYVEAVNLLTKKGNPSHPFHDIFLEVIDLFILIG